MYSKRGSSSLRIDRVLPKCISNYSDLVRSLIQLNKKTEPLLWTKTCRVAFDVPKNVLTKSPVIIFEIFKNISKPAWSAVVTQINPNMIDGNCLIIKDWFTCVRNLFQGSQTYWATSREEACRIYMAVKLEVSWYSLEQYIGFVVRQAFNYCCSLHQV